MDKTYSIIFWLILFPLITIGQALEYFPKLLPSSYTVYDIEQGLPKSCISEVFVDRKGRLWLNYCYGQEQEIIKSQGFYQYDGNKYHDVSMTDPGDATPYIYHLEGITSTGLFFGANKEKSKYFVLNPDNLNKQFFSFDEGEIVLNLMTGDGGELYVLTKKGSNRLIYALKDNLKKVLVSIPFDKDSEAENYIMNTPAVSSVQSIWLLKGHVGFIEYNIKRNTIRHYDWNNLLDSGFIPTAKENQKRDIIRFTVDHQGNPLFYFPGLNRFYFFDAASGQLKRMKQIDDFFKLAGNAYPSFYKDAQNNTLINIARGENTPVGLIYSSTTALLDNKGALYDYTPIASLSKKGRFKNFVGNYFFSSNFKRNVAIATHGGLIVADLKMDFAIQNFFKDRPARGLAEISPQQFLVVNEIDQQVLIDRNGNETSLWKAVSYPDSKDFIAGLSPLIQRKGKIWFVTNNGQLANLEKNTGAISLFQINKSFEKFTFINDNEIAFVDNEFGLNFYDLAQKKLKPFLSKGVPLNIKGTANELYVSRDGILWIASLNGLWKIDNRNGVAERMGKENGFRDGRIICIREAADGQLWLGTYGGGIHIYDPKSGSVQIIDDNDGLSNNTVVGLLQDNEGYWWAATYNGLTVLSEDGLTLFELSENEGISHREFNRFSCLKTSDGKLLFGSVDGVNLLDPEKIKARYESKEGLQIYLTDITYFDKKTGGDIHLQNQAAWPEQIIIPADKRYIEVDFGLSDYNNPDRNNFLYRISRPGQEQDASVEQRWTSIGYNSKLILNDLPVGDYTILIKALNYKGERTEKPIAIKVSVREFFYKTWWFYLLITIPILGAAWFWIRRLSTEKKRMEAEVEKRTQQIKQDKALIERQAAKLLELDEMKSRFFTNISHEFRTPLTIISGMVTQIRQHPEQWLEKGMELIHRNSNQLLSLINQILDLRKLESGSLKPDLIQSNIIPYLRYLCESIAPMAESKGVRIHFLSTPTEVIMDYDPDKMLHILSNLLSNAIKYTPGKGDIYVQIELGTEDVNEWLNIRVRDTGQGIAPEALPFIFDRFYQVEDLASQKPHGSGIGLALTQELVKLLKGTIEVESTFGKGTTFFLRFPITRNAKLQPDNFTSVETKSIQPQLGKMPEINQATLNPAEISKTTKPPTDVTRADEDLPSVLVVEDNADIRLYISSILENRYRVLNANDGSEGIKMATEFVPDLIVSDVMMPVKDGYELCDTLKNDERTSHIPIVLLTAKADFESKMRGLRKGADAYLTKPFVQEEFLLQLEQLLALRRKLRERYQLAAETVPAPSPEVYELEDAFIQKLRQLVLDNITEEDFGVVQLCRGLGVSRTQLHNKVKALTNQSTSEFVRMVKLYKAKELLQTTDKNISEVGYEVGISNPAYFSRIYAEAFGEPPRNTRNG